jgi:hypothetical protein
MVRRRLLRRLKRDTAAVAMTEFALAAPLMLTVGLYGLEMANYAIVHMEISQSAMHVADNASRVGDTSTLVDRKIYEADLNDLLYGVDLQAGDKIDLMEYGRVIVSSLEVDPDDHTGTQQYIHWQRCMGKKGFSSSYGEEGDGKGDPSFIGMGPAGEEVIAMPGEAVIFVEISYTYQPIVTDAFLTNREITVFSSFNVRDSRDITQIYQADPADPDPISDCANFSSYKTTPTLRAANSGGWNWNWFGGSSSSGGSTSTTTGSSTTSSSGSASGGSTTTSSSGGSSTSSSTSGGSTTTTSSSTGGSTTTTSSSSGGSSCPRWKRLLGWC